MNAMDTARSFLQEIAMSQSVKLAGGIVLAICTSLASAQSTLGALLDAGATPLTADMFRQEVVRRVIVGPTAAGGSLEVVYTENGTVEGTGTHPNLTMLYGQNSPIDGQWTIDDQNRICTAMVIKAQAGNTIANLPRRCQFWFKSGDLYYISDSDSDRSAKVLKRMVKQ